MPPSISIYDPQKLAVTDLLKSFNKTEYVFDEGKFEKNSSEAKDPLQGLPYFGLCFIDLYFMAINFHKNGNFVEPQT